MIPRTEMTYPDHSMKLHQNAANPVKAPVDHVMMDFEDACPYEFKGPQSRECVVEALNTLDFGKKVITVRPNNMRSEFFLGDMEAIVKGAPDILQQISLIVDTRTFCRVSTIRLVCCRTSGIQCSLG